MLYEPPWKTGGQEVASSNLAGPTTKSFVTNLLVGPWRNHSDSFPTTTSAVVVLRRLAGEERLRRRVTQLGSRS